MIRRRTFLRGSTAVSVGLLAGLAGCTGEDGDEEFPTQSLEWMIPWSEGGGTDQFARQMGPIMEEELGESIEIDNRPGASQQLGTEYLYNQPNDGHYFGTVTIPGWQIAWLIEEVEDWDVTEFEPISYHGTFGYTIIANETHGIGDFEELRAAYNDGELANFAFQGVGSASHVVTHLLRDEFDMEWGNAVPYDGGSEVNEAVISDEVPAGIATDTSAVDAVDSGNANMVVNLTTQELETFPDAESIADYGDDIDYVTQFFPTQIAPPGTPEDVREVLTEAVQASVEHEDTQEWQEDTGNIVEYGDMDDAAERVEGTLDDLEANVDIEAFREQAEEND